MKNMLATQFVALGLLLLSPVAAQAAAISRGAGAACSIDNDDSVETSMYISAGVYYNGSAASTGKLQCSFPVGLYDVSPNAHDVDVIEIYVYDGNNDTTTGVVTAIPGTHSMTSESVWSSCGQDSTNDSSIANITLQWTGLNVTSSCTDFTDRSLFASVTLADGDFADSAMIGFYVAE